MVKESQDVSFEDSERCSSPWVGAKNIQLVLALNILSLIMSAGTNVDSGLFLMNAALIPTVHAVFPRTA